MNSTTEINEHHTPSWGIGPYSIKRHGTTLQTCESEPIQTPGCIQSHGAVLVLRQTDLTILQVSENSLQHLGRSPQDLLTTSVTDVIGESNSAILRDMLLNGSVERTSLYAFTISIDAASSLDVCIHTIDNVVILEFEATERLAANSDRDYFSIVRLAVKRMQASNSLREFCQCVTEEVCTITGLDRAMVYRFHADFHGEVFAESKRDDLSPLFGLHYPAEDIPKQARDIYKQIWIRQLPDATGPLVELVPLANPDSGRPLDMTYCSLRGASVMYTEYLANMGVVATLSMPILIDGELWGLIICHHHTPKYFPHQIRAACAFLAQVTSLQLKTVEQSEQLIYRLKLEGIHQQLVARAAQQGDLMALSEHQPSLMDAMDATGAALYHLGRWWCAGKTPGEQHLDELADWLNQRAEFESPTRSVFVTDSLSREYAAGAEIADVASGVLAVRVSRLKRDLIIWFRAETRQTVSWAGDPHDKMIMPGPNGSRLTPRTSFELFIESVRGRSLPWSTMEVDSALRLRMLVMELVVSRAERLTELNADLTRSNDELDAFAYVASHDLKEPLRGIHKSAHQLLENAQSLDSENRKRVENLMRLTVRMDSLLDSLLHFSRVGRMTLEMDIVDLNEVVKEAIEMIGGRRSDCMFNIEIPRPLPPWKCDRVRVREIFSNLLSNAMKYTHRESPHIAVGYLNKDEPPAQSNDHAAALGHTIFYVRDNGIGVEKKYFDQVFRMFKRLHGREEFGGGVGAGLTIVQKLVQRHGGQVWIDSTIDVGTTFFFTLPCGEELSA